MQARARAGPDVPKRAARAYPAEEGEGHHAGGVVRKRVLARGPTRATAPTGAERKERSQGPGRGLTGAFPEGGGARSRRGRWLDT